jgi:hypothetical protein
LDRAVGEVPLDARIPSIQTGYLHLELPEVAADGLEAFLASGRPPVYAGFGSMPRQDQAHNVPMLVRAARAAGQRIIIGRFWEGSSAYDKADDVFFLKDYPHLTLFPRMAAVIHHGGAGTTATCAVSGVPQVIVPHVLDAGQCNDSYSLAVIALKLKKAFGLKDINELPISYDIAWYEQKAVAVL